MACKHLSDCKKGAIRGLVVRCINFGHWERCESAGDPLAQETTP